jgi:hypothetical protein
MSRLLVVLLLAACAAHAREIADPDRRFSLEVPEGFNEWPADRPKPHALTLRAFYRLDRDDESRLITLDVRGLGAPLARQFLRSEFLDGEVPLEASWRGIKLQLVRLREYAQGREKLRYAVQVPLVPEGIEIVLSGPAAFAGELQGWSYGILRSLKGEPGFAAPASRRVTDDNAPAAAASAAQAPAAGPGDDAGPDTAVWIIAFGALAIAAGFVGYVMLQRASPQAARPVSTRVVAARPAATLPGAPTPRGDDPALRDTRVPPPDKPPEPLERPPWER